MWNFSVQVSVGRDRPQTVPAEVALSNRHGAPSMTTDDFADELGRLAGRHRKQEELKEKARLESEEREKDALVDWRENCDRVILPIFHEVADHPDFRGDGVTATVKDDGSRVSLKINRERLTFSFDSRSRNLTLDGYPQRVGLSGELTTRTMDAAIPVQAAWLRGIVKDFIRHALEVNY